MLVCKESKVFSIFLENVFLPATTKLWPRLCFYSCLWFCPWGGVCLSACWDTTPWSRHQPGADTPLEQTPHPPGADTPWSRHPPGVDTPPPPPRSRPPWEQTPPQSRHTPPSSRHPPRADPPEQTPPRADTRSPSPESILQHKVNKRPVRILLECILVFLKINRLLSTMWFKPV